MQKKFSIKELNDLFQGKRVRIVTAGAGRSIRGKSEIQRGTCKIFNRRPGINLVQIELNDGRKTNFSPHHFDNDQGALNGNLAENGIETPHWCVIELL